MAGEGSCDIGCMIEADHPGIWIVNSVKKKKRYEQEEMKELAFLDLCISM